MLPSYDRLNFSEFLGVAVSVNKYNLFFHVCLVFSCKIPFNRSMRPSLRCDFEVTIRNNEDFGFENTHMHVCQHLCTL